MAITQLGLHGPQMAYAGFSPKTESVVTVSDLALVGEYVASIAVIGESVTAISVMGEYQTAIDVVGEFE
jgi:predicted RNA-binding protein